MTIFMIICIYKVGGVIMFKNDKKRTLIMLLVVGVLVVLVGASYAFITFVIDGQKQVIVNAGVLDLIFNEGNELTLAGELPMYDEVGMIKEPFTFSLTNNSPIEVNYKLKLVNVTPDVVVTDRKCSELGEITIDSPKNCRKVEYPSELREEALTMCQNWYDDVTTEEDCLVANANDDYLYKRFEDLIDEYIFYGTFEDSRRVVEVYPDNFVEEEKLDVGLLKYGLTKNGVSKVDYLLNMDSSIRDKAVDLCKRWYFSDDDIVTEEICVEEVGYTNFEEFVVESIQYSSLITEGKELVIDEGIISGGETINYNYRTWIDSTVFNDWFLGNRTFKFKFDVEVEQPLSVPENQECFAFDVNDYIVKDYKTCIDYLVEKGIASDYMAPTICQEITEGTYDIETKYPDELQDMISRGIIAREKGITITDYMCTDDVVVIPEVFLVTNGNGVNVPRSVEPAQEYIPVVAIGNRAFGELYIMTSTEDKKYSAQFMEMTQISSISSVSIPNSVTSIGEGAFSNSGLQSVKLSNNLQIIGNHAFYSNQLTEIVLPQSLTVVDHFAFHNNDLRTITIPSNVYSIRSAGIGLNNNLTKIVNKTGKVFDWSDILFFDFVEPFAYGTITNYDGTQTVNVTNE